MPSIRNLLLQGALYVSLGAATNLYVASSEGALTTLALTETGGTFDLSVSSVSQECAGNPADVRLDPVSGIVYCLDRARTGVANGSLNSFSRDADGNLTRIDRVSAPPSGVSTAIFGTAGGKQGLVSVHYNASAIATFGFAGEGKLDGDGPLEQLFPTLATRGPVAARQDRSYMHQVQLDPKEKFLVMNDLGGDMIRIFSWNAETLSPLAELDPIVTEAGVGPRHGVFWTSPADGSLYYIFVGELAQKVFSYKIEYTATGISGAKVFEIPCISADKPALNAPPSEILLSPDNRFIIVSNRDNSFRRLPVPSDTMSTFSIAANGTLALIQLTESGGWSPRQVALNKAGDLLAVGHQNNNSVVIWKRDVETGMILTGDGGEPAAVVTLSGAVVCTIWDEL